MRCWWFHKQAFVRGDLHTTLTAPGISEILDFTFYPFGNAYIGNGPDVPCDALTCTVYISTDCRQIYIYIYIHTIHPCHIVLMIDWFVGTMCTYTYMFLYKLKLTTHHFDMKKVEGFYAFYNESTSSPDGWNACGTTRSCWSAYCGNGGAGTEAECTTGDAVYQVTCIHIHACVCLIKDYFFFLLQNLSVLCFHINFLTPPYLCNMSH
jgi:hypothetical protein